MVMVTVHINRNLSFFYTYSRSLRCAIASFRLLFIPTEVTRDRKRWQFYMRTELVTRRVCRREQASTHAIVDYIFNL